MGTGADDVGVEAVPGDQRTAFLIRVNPGDVGKVIGRQGRTSQSLRVLAGAMGMKLRQQFTVEVEEHSRADTTTDSGQERSSLSKGTSECNRLQ
jgi:predicted RNA-binding protein YlqC (UPF0109 family)